MITLTSPTPICYAAVQQAGPTGLSWPIACSAHPMAKHICNGSDPDTLMSGRGPCIRTADPPHRDRNQLWIDETISQDATRK
jgi:hypothetical protein